MPDIQFNKKKVLIWMQQNIVTRKQLADKADLDYVTVSSLFSRDNNPELSTCYKIAKAIGINLEELIIDNR